MAKDQIKLPAPNPALNSVGIIMDGNGRWAKKRFLPRSAGHIAGAKIIQSVLSDFREMGVHHVTLYAFSTENWKRPKEEVDGLMKLIYKYLVDVVEPKVREDESFCMRFLGDKGALPEMLREKCIEIENLARGREFVCNLALNYGGRDEIIAAANAAFAECGGPITKEDIARHLYTCDSPDPDLIIRTGGECRISNFLLWQGAYSELHVTDTLWPDFGRADIKKAVDDFYSRQRRYGGVIEE